MKVHVGNIQIKNSQNKNYHLRSGQVNLSYIFDTKSYGPILPSSAQTQAPAGLSSIIITVVRPAIRPEKYDLQARAMLGFSLASWKLL